MMNAEGYQNYAYGSAETLLPQSAPVKGYFLKGRRQTMNIYAIILGFFIPWLLCITVIAALSFKLRYESPLLAYGIVLACFCVVLFIGSFALRNSWDKLRMSPEGVYQPSWLMFVFLTSLLAFLFAAWAGEHIYSSYTLHFYRRSEMTTYNHINPSLMGGAQLMDAGVVNFVNETKIDLGRWMSFKDKKVYCVAPIIQAQAPNLTNYDFWAVGTDCCAQTWMQGAKGSRMYHCGDFNRVNASTGLRLMNDAHHAFYRLAVQQAEAAYHIRSAHPLFFHWTDPSGGEGSSSHSSSAKYDAGMAFFKRCIVMTFVMQLWFVMIACIAFSRLGYY